MFWKMGLGLLAIIVATLLLAVIPVYIFDSIACKARWEGSYRTEWSLMGGCRIEVDGKFIPEKNMRQF